MNPTKKPHLVLVTRQRVLEDELVHLIIGVTDKVVVPWLGAVACGEVGEASVGRGRHHRYLRAHVLATGDAQQVTCPHCKGADEAPPHPQWAQVYLAWLRPIRDAAYMARIGAS
jgi:hypothetical protein